MLQSTSIIFLRFHIPNRRWWWPRQNSDKTTISYRGSSNSRNIPIFPGLALLKIAAIILHRVTSGRTPDFKSHSSPDRNYNTGLTLRTHACKRCTRSCFNSRLRRREISWICFKRRNKWCRRLLRIGKIIRTNIYLAWNSKSNKKMTCCLKLSNP